MNDDEWVGLFEACPKGLNASEIKTWRHTLVSRLQTGRLEAKASSFKYFCFECSYSEVCWMTQKCDCSAQIKRDISQALRKDNLLLPASFWRDSHGSDQEDWPKKADTLSTCSDWVTGDFAVVQHECLIPDEPYTDETGLSHWPPECEETVWVHWALDVQIPSRFLARINSKFKTSPESQKVRKSKYDWPGALSHLVALAELEGLVSDPDEHGAQAKVERALTDWFANSGRDIPSEAAIRPYAAKVLAAIKAQGQKVN